MPNPTLIERVLVTMMANPLRMPDTYLDPYFTVLRSSKQPQHREAAEERIWQIWCSHDDADATDAMASVIEALARDELDAAEEQLDAIVERWPDWAEAWNKRATLRFLQERDAESLNDIQRTLELEARHFGAMSGFGQICLRARDPASALMAFEQALAINPNLEAVREATAVLQKQVPRTIH